MKQKKQEPEAAAPLARLDQIDPRNEQVRWWLNNQPMNEQMMKYQTQQFQNAGGVVMTTTSGSTQPSVSYMAANVR